MNEPFLKLTTIFFIICSITWDALPFDNLTHKLDSIRINPSGWNHSKNNSTNDLLIQQFESNVPVVQYWEWFSVGKAWDTLSYKFTSHDSLVYFWNSLDSTISQTLIMPEVNFKANMLILTQPFLCEKQYRYGVKITENDSSILLTIRIIPPTKKSNLLISITPLMAFELPISNKKVKLILDRSAYSRWHQK